MDFISVLLEKSRLLTILHDNLSEDIKTSGLYNDMARYLQDYAAYNNISAELAIEFYTNYIALYNRHCKSFIKTSKYPLKNGMDAIEISRQEYDIVLLLSVLFTPHRYRIMQLIQQNKENGKALFIGLGPGIEMTLTKNKYEEVHAYDLAVNNFLAYKFPGVFLNNELYTGQYTGYFDSIYLVEILEHLEYPFELLKICANSLKKGGKIFLTTATDIPQFDHLFNFPEDHKDFELGLANLNVQVLYKEKISHAFMTAGMKPHNHYYEIIKN